MTDDKPTDVVGHKTFRVPGRAPGEPHFRHEPLLRAEADEMLARAHDEDAKRRELMPDEAAAIKLFFDAWVRLKEFGWNDAIYCPKNGTQFLVIEAGSTGQHRCIYEGDWPNGHWWILEDGDMSPSRPTLFRAIASEDRHE